MTIEQIASETRKMDRATLEADHVTAGVAKWGEAERSGLQRQARAKSLATLRIQRTIRAAEAAGIDEQAIRDWIPEGDTTAATGAAEDGPS